LEEWFALPQVDLVERPYVVTEHRAREYLDPRIGRIVIAPLPIAVKAAGLVGPKLCALAAYHIDRHITQGTRGKRGQRWCERVWTVIAASRQQKRRVFAFFCQALNAISNNKPPPRCYAE
jgi:hypothetical protein